MLAILDDYQAVALTIADWTSVQEKAEVVVFHDHQTDPDALVARLLPFQILCVMRERTPLPRALLERLPNLKLILSTGHRNASIDTAAAEELGITVKHTGYFPSPTVELTWTLILGGARHLATEVANVKSGGWQTTLGDDLAGKTLGVLGLGELGSRVAKVGVAFGMDVIAWSQNLTAERAAEVGARLVDKDTLFSEADVLTIHVVLSKRTRGLVGAHELSLMKPTARLVNTSRGPIVVEAELVKTLAQGKIAGAAMDVCDVEPLPLDHPYRKEPRATITPHIGYVTHDLYRLMMTHCARHAEEWLARV